MITPDIATAYTECQLKSYLLLYSDKKGGTHEYISIMAEETEKNREKYLIGIKKDVPAAELYSIEGFEKGTSVLLEANLIFHDLKAHVVSLTRAKAVSSQTKHHYSPTLVVGTHKIAKEQKFHLAFIAHVLSNIQKGKPVSGTIVVNGGKAHTIKLTSLYKDVETVLKQIKVWTQDINSLPPPIILNKHCSLCPFQEDCENTAAEKDDLSLLSRLSQKEIQKYHKKGIFTVNQLSYLFRPRKQRKRKQTPKSPLHYRAEIQALAIRTKKIYIQELPVLCRPGVELFLDIEGTPDQDSYYLIGLIVVNGDKKSSHSFWADSINDEQQIWDSFIEKTNEYPDAPIYYYGSYDAKAVRQLKNRYGNGSETMDERLVNVTTLIYGKIYFPVRANSLKKLGFF
jgi:predicted RecB family nuclease